MIYIDISAIIKLYIKESYTKNVSDWIKRNNKAIPLTDFHELEFYNAINLKQFRNELSKHDAGYIISRFNSHENQGIYYRIRLDPAELFIESLKLSNNYTKTTGARSLDILHVASALIIKARKFLTFDERQAKLAALAGLKLEKCV